MESLGSWSCHSLSQEQREMDACMLACLCSVPFHLSYMICNPSWGMVPPIVGLVLSQWNSLTRHTHRPTQRGPFLTEYLFSGNSRLCQIDRANTATSENKGDSGVLTLFPGIPRALQRICLSTVHLCSGCFHSLILAHGQYELVMTSLWI